MHCSPVLFALSHELKAFGVQPRFEVGQVVAHGFADLGSEEFLVLPGPKLLSLTAGGVKDLPDEHRSFFYWIPSIEECRKLLEGMGCHSVVCARSEQRTWTVECEWTSGRVLNSGRILHEVMIQSVIEVKKCQIQSCGEINV